MLSPLKAEVSRNGTPKRCAHCRPDELTHLGRDDAVVLQIRLVGDEDDFDVLRRQVLDLVHPLVDGLEALLVRDAVHHDDAVRRC